MTKEEIIDQVSALGFPKGSFVVFGSCPLAVAGIRDANDIDLFVSPELFADLRARGWQQQYRGPKDRPLVDGVFEAHESWDFDGYSATLGEIMARAFTVKEIAFASLADVRNWKFASNRSKDHRDVELIDRYFAERNVT